MSLAAGQQSGPVHPFEVGEKQENRILYVALGNAGQVGDSDRPPLIVMYEIP